MSELLDFDRIINRLIFNIILRST